MALSRRELDSLKARFSDFGLQEFSESLLELGFSYCTMQNHLTNTSDKLNTFTKAIAVPILKNMVAQVKKDLVQSGSTTPTSHQQNVLDVENLLLSIQAYCQASLIAKQSSHHVPLTTIVAYTFPQSIPKELATGIATARPFSGVYNTEELQHYFSSLIDTLSSSTLLLPISFILQSGAHSITLTYDAQKESWLASNLKTPFTTNGLIPYLQQQFNSDTLIFSTQIFTSQQQEADLQTWLKEWQSTLAWQRIHTVTPEKTSLASDNGTWLHIATQLGDVELTEQLLAAGANPNLPYGDATPLSLATECGEVDVAYALLNAGADPHYVLPTGMTPFFMSIHQHQLLIFELFLIQNKINVNEIIHPETNASALHFAVGIMNYDAISLLLKHGADVNQLDSNEFSALSIAILLNDPISAKLLIAAGANPHLLTEENLPLLHFAIRQGPDSTAVAIELLNSKILQVNQLDHHGATAAFYAAKSNNVEVLRRLMELGANVNLKPPHHPTPLLAAILNGHVAAAEVLLTRANPNIDDPEQGISPLMAALELYEMHPFQGSDETNPYFNLIQNLLIQKADPNFISSEGFTPLFIAARIGNARLVKLLLDHQASLTMDLSNGQTPLYVAAKRGHASVVKLLLERGADPFLGPTPDKTPFNAAIIAGRDQVLSVLLKQSGINVYTQRISDDATAVCMATAANQPKTLKVLLDNNALATFPQRDGKYPLMVAAEKGYLEVAELLIPHTQIDVQHRRSSSTALILAAENNQAKIVKLLLDNNANTAILNNQHENALTVAIKKGHKDVVYVFAKSKMDLNTADIYGTTPLMTAISYQLPIITEILLQNGAKPNVADKANLTALHYAVLSGNLVLTNTLLEYLADPNFTPHKTNTPLTDAIRLKDADIVRALVKYSVNVNTACPNQQLPLHTAVELGFAEISNVLIHAGADINRPSPITKLTPLMTAIINKQVDCVRVLLAAGADIHASLIDGRNAFHLAQELVDSQEDLQTPHEIMSLLKEAVAPKRLGIVPIRMFDGSVPRFAPADNYIPSSPQPEQIATPAIPLKAPPPPPIKAQVIILKKPPLPPSRRAENKGASPAVASPQAARWFASPLDKVPMRTSEDTGSAADLPKTDDQPPKRPPTPRG